MFLRGLYVHTVTLEITEEDMAASAYCVELAILFIFVISGDSQDPQLEDVDIQFHASLMFAN